MGRHTASRASLTSVLSTAVRRGTHGALAAVPREVPRARRSAFGVGAAAAAVALTATTAAATFVDGSAPSGAEPTSWPTTSPTTGTTTLAAPVVSADPETVEAASDALVRAQFVTSEGAAALTPEQVAQIAETQARLSEAVAAARPTTAATLEGSVPLPAQAAALDGSAADDTTETETPELAVAEPELAADGVGALEAGVLPLAERTSDRASRSTARTPLADLAAPLPVLTGTDDVPAPAAPDAVADDATPAAEGADTTDAAAAADVVPDDTTDVATDEPVAAPTDEVAPAPTAEEISALTAELTTLLDAAGSGVAVQVVPGPPSAEEVAAQLAQWAASTASYGNGEIPSSALCDLSFAPGEQLRCDAAHQIEALNVKYREAFGTNLSVTDSYRSYSSQVAVKASRGYFAAPPGMSNHGWALALDLGGGIQSYGTAQYEWMRANAPAYGWDNPEWARAGGSKNEPWHWEYGTPPQP